MLVFKQLTIAIEPYYESQCHRQLFEYQHSSKYLLLCSTEERNSEIMMTSFSFLGELSLCDYSESIIWKHNCIFPFFKGWLENGVCLQLC